MGIDSITSTNSMSGIRMTMTSSTEPRNKSIQKEITDTQQQMRTLSSKEELSVSEKENERKTLRKKITSLNTELKQHQEEFRKSQKREIMMADLQKETGFEKDSTPKAMGRADGTSSDMTAEQRLPVTQLQTEENKKAGIAQEETKPLDRIREAEKEQARKEEAETVSTDPSAQQQDVLQGTVITRTGDGIVILKEGRKQDEIRGVAAAQTTDESSLRQTTGQTSPTDSLQTKENKETDTSEKEAKSLEDAIDADRGLSQKEIYGMVSADASVQQVGRQETVIARIEGGVAVLKGEMKQDELRGIETDAKQTELEKTKQREERARIFQSYVLGEANDAMKSAANADETQNSTAVNAKNNTFVRAFQLSQEAQTSQQKFYVSLDN